MKILKSRKAQQLVEFLFVAPFIIIFLGILTEYAFALHCNLTLTQGLKSVTAKLYRDIRPNMTSNDIRNLVETNLLTYLSNNNIPNGAVDVGFALSGESAVIMATYEYTPAFTLPPVYFHILPDNFTFFATSIVPRAFMNENGYPTLTTNALSGIWAYNGNLSSLDNFNNYKNGAMTNSLISSPGNIIFLVKLMSNIDNTYALVPWNGNLNSGTATAVSTDTGTTYFCTLAPTEYATCIASGSFPNYSNIIFVHDFFVPENKVKMQSYWAHVKGNCDVNNCAGVGTSTPISSQYVDGILKRALSLYDFDMDSTVGNYDNLDVSKYNPGISIGQIYKMESKGSRIFIYRPLSDNINNL